MVSEDISSFTLAFPPELIEQIIVAAQADTRCLRACALTSQLFYSITSKYLFHRVYVCALPANSAEKLHAILKISPHLRPLIHSITAELTHCQIYPAAFSNLFLHKFPSLERLDIVGASWRFMPKAAKDSIWSALRTNDLQWLVLNGVVEFPLRQLQECQSLRKLALVNSSYDENPFSVSTGMLAISAPIYLTSLRLAPFPVSPQEYATLCESLNWLKSSSCPFSISRLQNLSLRTSHLEGATSLFNELFRLIDPLSLEWLNLDIRHDGNTEFLHSPHGKLKLPQFSSMRKVQLRLDFNGDEHYPTLFSDMIATAALLLEDLEACSSVDEIRVKFVEIVYTNSGIQVSDINTELCSRIDSKLATMEALRRVDFVLQRNLRHPLRPEVPVLVENLFPSLRARGVLCVTQTIVSRGYLTYPSDSFMNL